MREKPHHLRERLMKSCEKNVPYPLVQRLDTRWLRLTTVLFVST